MNIFFCFKSDFSHLSLLKYLPASIKSFTSIHFTFYISYWQDFTHIHIICSIYIFEPSLPRQHHGNHTVGYCASYFVFFMNKYVNISNRFWGSAPPSKTHCVTKQEKTLFEMGLEEFDTNEMVNKVQGILSGMVALSGVAMVVGGIVVLAVDCPTAPNHPWVLLVWGLVTIMLYGLVVLATHDR